MAADTVRASSRDGASRRAGASRGGSEVARAPEGYLQQSMRPWPVLLFLLPLIVAYEWGSLVFLADGSGHVTETIAARYLMEKVFELFGAIGLYLPGIALVVVLLVQHLIGKHSWRVRPATLLGMLAESCGLTVPLLVLAWLTSGVALAAITGSGAAGFEQIGARVTIALGAGIYEELVFRMVLIALVHTIFQAVLRTSSTTAGVAAVVVSASLFTLYHPLFENGVFLWHKALFYSVAGVYFAVLYLWRGFGIIVAVHAIYDVVVLVPWGGSGDSG